MSEQFKFDIALFSAAIMATVAVLGANLNVADMVHLLARLL
jgi:hypothetical protein